jgi:hypothetical protein
MRALFVLLLLASCGDDGGTATPDGAVDAPDPPPADAPPTGCDYTEQRDGTNDDVSPATGTAEDTQLAVGARTVICGAFEHTHFDGDITVDIDAYRLTVSGEVTVRIAGAGAEAIELVGVDIYGGPAFDQRVGAVTFYGDHGVTSLTLPAGTYELLPFALASQAIAATVPYTLSIQRGAPCMQATSGGYPEAHDGAASAGNDVVAFPVGSPSALTASAADMPEPTGQTLVAQGRVTGTAADVAVADRYEDKDTYAFMTGAGVNELAVLVEWTGAADLDAYLFEADNPDPVVRGLGTAAGSEPVTFSVKPNAAYWLLVGAKAGGNGLPAAYSASLCGATFTP